jgi:hypothetical protein
MQRIVDRVSMQRATQLWEEIYIVYTVIKRVTFKMGGGRKLDDGQLLLTVTDKRQTRLLVREGTNRDKTAIFFYSLY